MTTHDQERTMSDTDSNTNQERANALGIPLRTDPAIPPDIAILGPPDAITRLRAQFVADYLRDEAAGGLDAAELNPNHPVTRTLHDHWHKIAAILLMKLIADDGRHAELEITEQDVIDLTEMLGPGGAIIADTRGGRLVLRAVTGDEAAALAREAGGRRS
jgi:hypothetical protein